MLIREKYPDTILSKLFGSQTYIPPVMGPSNRLAVAEAAGAEENASGLPLVGGSGKIFDSLLRKAGIRRDDISIINTLPCQPPNNSYPTDPSARVYCTATEGQEAVAYSYQHYVEPVLKARPWTRIDAIGEKSLRLLTGKTEGIMKWRGSPLPLKGETKARVIGILHPSYLMRDGAMIPATISDLCKGTQIPPQYYNTKPTVEDLEGFDARELVFDIETNRFTQQITMVGIADARRAYHVDVVPFHGAYIPQLKRIFLNAEAVIGQNIIGFDLDRLKDAGVITHSDAQIWDIMLMHHLIQPDAPHDLEYIASIFTQMVAWKHLNVVDMAWYNGCDVDATAQIYSQLRPLLKQFDLEKLYKLVQVPLAKICKKMSETGIKVDPNKIRSAREKFLAEFNELEKQLPKELQPYDKTTRVRRPAPAGTIGKSGKPVKFIHIAGTERVAPWNSPDACKKWLYETMQYPKQLHPKTKKITASKSALERLYRKTKNPQLQTLQKLQSLDTLLSTTLKEEDKNEPVTRIHANFLVHGTNCLAPETKVLTKDLRWVSIDTVQINDTLIAFDEYGKFRQLQESIVHNKEEHILPCYKVTFDNGLSVVASDKHGWLAQRRKKSEHSIYSWVHTENLKVGERVGFFHYPWGVENSFDAGYVAGILDGEGSLHKRTGALTFTQNPTTVVEDTKAALTKCGFTYSQYTYPNSSMQLQHILIHDAIKVLGTVRPKRLLNKSRTLWAGRHAYQNKNVAPSITSIEFIGEQKTIGLQTSTSTIIAEGFLTHNTGRLSSSSPNMQNITQRARYIYVPSYSDWCFVEADFSSLENRLAAWYAGDTDRLARLSQPGFNEHRWLASKIYGIPESELTKEMWQYKRGKNTNHGADGAMGPRKLAMTYDVPEKEARELLFKWREINHKSAAWQERVGNEAIKNGILTNAFGRKRWFWSQSSYTEGIRFNPQSTGADICFRSMIAMCYEQIEWPIELAAQVVSTLSPLPKPARLVLQVHDSLLIECPYNLREDVIKCMETAMTQPWPELAGFSIPVDIKTGNPGDSWGELEHIKI